MKLQLFRSLEEAVDYGARLEHVIKEEKQYDLVSKKPIMSRKAVSDDDCTDDSAVDSQTAMNARIEQLEQKFAMVRQDEDKKHGKSDDSYDK